MHTWDATGKRNGVQLRVRFFDGVAADSEPDPVRRSLCFLPGTIARLQWSELNRRNLRWGAVVAQSDGVYTLGQGLVQLEFKSRSGRSLDRQTWLRDVRPKDMLQCLIAAVVVAQTQGRLCAALLRYHDAGLLLVPEQRLMDLVFGLVPLACTFYGTSDVSASDLAAFVEPRVQKDFPWRDEQRSRAGVLAHERLFR
jgi:hypothetical protein